MLTRIAFERYGDNISELPKGIYTINPDGSDCQRILNYGSRPKWSPDGQLIAFQEKTEDNDWLSSIFVMRATGQDVRRVTFHNDIDTTPAYWSPDSKQIVYSLWYWQEKLHQICVMDLQTGKFTQITHGEDDNAYPVWTPNNEIVFIKYTDPQQSGRLFIMSPNGQNQRECDLFTIGDCEPVWSYDGKKIVFRREDTFCAMNSDGSELQTIPTHGRVPQMVISPDGQFVAYSSCDDTGESGFEVFVTNLDGTEKRKIVSNPCSKDKEVDSQDISWSPVLQPPHPQVMQLYIYKNNQQYGPYQEQAVISWLQNGHLSFDDLACTFGMNKWSPLYRLLKPQHNADYDMELALLERYFQEAQNFMSKFMAEDSVMASDQMQSEVQRKIGLFEKQLRFFKIQFLDSDEWRYYESELYVFRAFLTAFSVGFLRRTAATSGLLVGITTGLLANQQERNNMMQALALLDKALELYDSPSTRMLKVDFYLALNQKAQALQELNYVISNFPNHKEAYLAARQKRDELYS
jgi:hypothetical protein